MNDETRKQQGNCTTKNEGQGDANSFGVTRRGFLASVGAGAVAVATGGTASAKPPTEVLRPDEMARIALKINGRTYRTLVEPRWSLLHVLREELGLTGTKIGCGRGECGACTVLVDGRPQYACLMLAVEAEGTEITTVEGLLVGENLGPVQQAFVEQDAFQCGYCTPGQIMAVEGLLATNPNPDMDQIRRGVSGNLCRCGAYTHIFDAVRRAAELKSGGGGKP